MKKFLKWGGIIIIIIIVLAAITGSGKSNNSTNSTGNSEQAQEKPKAPEIVTAQQIADDFDGNQVAAEKNWSGKFVQFTATVSNITDSGLSFTNIGSKQFSMTQMSCQVKDPQQLLSLKNGESITVKGIIGKQTIGVIDMSDCEVVK